MKEPVTETELRIALAASVELQSHYAMVLNHGDDGHRMTFNDADEWLDHLRDNNTLPHMAHAKYFRERVIKECITRIMFRCGPGDSWKKNEKPDVSDIIVELSNLLDGPFTTEDAMEMAKRIGVSL